LDILVGSSPSPDLSPEARLRAGWMEIRRVSGWSAAMRRSTTKRLRGKSGHTIQIAKVSVREV